MEQDQYVTRLMKAKCSYGSMSNYLNLPKDHGVLFHNGDTPIMNANDHEPEKHIVHFGRCTSSRNPSNQVSMEDMILNAIFPGAIFGSKLLKKLLGCEGCKCKPLTITPWVDVKSDYHIDGAPAITINSTLTCYYGGTIEIEEEKAEGEGAEDFQQEITEKGSNAMALMGGELGRQIKDMCSRTFEEGTSQIGDELDYQADDSANYCVSPERRNANYAHNQNQTIPSGALDESGNIIDQSMLGNFYLGNGLLSDNGSGCVAVYNALNMLGQPTSLAELILYFELLPLILGIPFGSGAAFWLLGMTQYFVDKNYDVSLEMCSTDKKDTGKRNKNGLCSSQGKMSKATIGNRQGKQEKSGLGSSSGSGKTGKAVLSSGSGKTGKAVLSSGSGKTGKAVLGSGSGKTKKAVLGSESGKTGKAVLNSATERIGKAERNSELMEENKTSRKKAEVGIVGTISPGKKVQEEFVAVKQKEDKFQFLNVAPGATQDVRTMEDYTDSMDGEQILLTIQKKEDAS